MSQCHWAHAYLYLLRKRTPKTEQVCSRDEKAERRNCTHGNQQQKLASLSMDKWLLRRYFLVVECLFICHYKCVLSSPTGQPESDPEEKEKIYRRNDYDVLLVTAGVLVLMLLIVVIRKIAEWLRQMYRFCKCYFRLKRCTTKNFCAGDPYTICVLCTKEYAPGERLRILPCCHSFHRKCIDQHAIKNGWRCRVCDQFLFSSNIQTQPRVATPKSSILPHRHVTYGTVTYVY